jgi:putative ABC transport system permease protein
MFFWIYRFDRWILGQMNVVGWIISAVFTLVGGLELQYHVCFRERANKFNWDFTRCCKKQIYIVSILFEAIILSVIGGIIGLLLVWIISLILTNALILSLF